MTTPPRWLLLLLLLVSPLLAEAEVHDCDTHPDVVSANPKDKQVGAGKYCKKGEGWKFIDYEIKIPRSSHATDDDPACGEETDSKALKTVARAVAAAGVANANPVLLGAAEAIDLTADQCRNWGGQVREWLGDACKSQAECGVVAVRLPKGAHYRACEVVATDVGGAGGYHPCALEGGKCSVGWGKGECKEADGVVFARFKNWNAQRDRSFKLHVYFKAA